VMPVHISGRAAAMTALCEIAKRHRLFIVEDAAEALGSQVNGQALGTFGDVGCFSFSSNKTITTGQGGMVVTRDPVIYQRLRELKDQGRPMRGTGGADEHVSLGYNFKLTNLQAALGLAQWEQFAQRRQHLQDLYRFYREHLAQIASIRLFNFNLEGGECPQWIDVLVENRDLLHDYLLSEGIHTRKFWYPLHTQAPYRMPDDQFPVSTRVSARGLWLPSALSLNQQDIRRVCQSITAWSRVT